MGIPLGLPTDPLVAQPLSLLRIRLLHHYSFRDKIPFCLFLLYTSTSTSWFKWIRIGLPHHLPLWYASNGPNHLLLLLGEIPSPLGYIPKRRQGWKPNIDPLPHQTTKPYPLNPLYRGPTPFSRLVVLRPLYACSTILYFCLLSFPYHFGYNRLALFYSAACLCLISSCVSYCVCHFLWFNFSFLHAIFTADIS